MRLIFFILGIWCLNTPLWSQDQDFTADRPGLSDAPDLIKPNSFQIETGFDISKYNRYGLYQLSTNSLRYGLNSRIEIRMDFGIQYDPTQKIYGTNSPSFGIKTLLFKQNKVLPKAALVIEWFPPAFGNPQAPTGIGTELCLSHDLKNDDNIYYNGGLVWQNLAIAPTLNGLIGYNHEINSMWQIFFELYYFDTPQKPFNIVADMGISVQITKKLQIDFAFGLNVKKPVTTQVEI